MNFTLKQLRYAEAAARLGSIAKAAEEMAISQSSITAAIDTIEYWLGYDLFIRTPAKGIRMTSAGFKALDIMHDYLQTTNHFDAELKAIGGDTSGLVRIACYSTVAPSFLPFILRDVATNLPNLSIRVLEGHMMHNMRILDEGMADIAFTYEDVLQKNHKFTPLFKAPPYCLVSSSDELIDRPFVTIDDLLTKSMVLLDLPLSKEYYINLFEAHGKKPKIGHTTRSAEIARALVEGGFGYTLLNIRPPLTGGQPCGYRIIPLRNAGPDAHFGIATHATSRLPQSVLAFIKRCKILRDQGVFDKLLVQNPS